MLQRLRTPEKAQEFVYELKQNFEPNGDTCNSIRVVLRTRRAHCIEGASLAGVVQTVFGTADIPEVSITSPTSLAVTYSYTGTGGTTYGPSSTPPAC